MKITNKTSRAELVSHIQALESESLTQKQALNNAIIIANEFAGCVATIETLLQNSKFGKGKFFKTIFFVVTNWKEVKLLLQDLEDLILQIKEQITKWRNRLDELNSNAKQN